MILKIIYRENRMRRKRLQEINEETIQKILKINLIIGKKQNLVMRKKKAVRGRNIIIANGEKNELK